MSTPDVQCLIEENQRFKQQNLKLQQRLAELEHMVAWFKKQMFGGGKSEKIHHPDQLMFEFADKQASEPEQPVTEKISYERNKTKSGKRTSAEELFKDLPVAETVEILPEEVKNDPDLYERIGEETTFEVDVIPPRLIKRLLVRPKFRHRLNRSLPPLEAPAPSRVVEGGYASAGLLAWVAVSKYVDHLPLYRLEKMSARWGARIPRQSMADWVEQVAFWLKNIYNRTRQEILDGGFVQADETMIRYCDPDQKNGKTKQGYLWLIGQPHGPVVFDWRLGRAHVEAHRLLKGFRGVLQCDGYEAYESFCQRNPGVVRVGCWAHARRKFFEARESDPKRADFFLKMIGGLYSIESYHCAREPRLDKLRAVRRQQDLAATMERIRKAAVKVLDTKTALPQSPLGKACAYLLNQWERLRMVLEHGCSPLDNNLLENAVRPSAIGKKNWLFVGHPEAGDRSAIIYSIVVTCQRFGVDPLAYLRDVLSRLPTMNNQDDITPLLPHHWAAAQAHRQEARNEDQ